MTKTSTALNHMSEERQEAPSVVASSRKRRLGGRSRRVQAAVFAAAIDVLLSQGYEGFAIAEVAERAHVNQTSIYRRWGNKQTLLTEVLLSRAEDELPIPNSGTLRADLIAFLVSLASFLHSPLGNALLQISTIAMGRPELTSYRRTYWLNRIALVNAMFERAVARGEIPATLDTTLTLELLAGPIYVRTLFTAQSVDEAGIETIVDVVLGGMLQRSQGS